MATVYAAPSTIKPSTYNSDYKIRDADEQRFEDELRAFCKENSKCPHAGEIIRFHVADGYACYMVFSYTKLIIIETGDAYQIPDAYARGLRKDDIIQKIKSEKAIRALFATK